MKISNVIERLEKVKEEYGDVDIAFLSTFILNNIEARTQMYQTFHISTVLDDDNKITKCYFTLTN